MAKFTAHLSIGLVGCGYRAEFEIPDEDLAGLSRFEAEDRIATDAREVVEEHIEVFVTLGGEEDYNEFNHENNRYLNDFELIPALSDGDG